MRHSTELAGTDKLSLACFELARINKRCRRPIDASEISALADTYMAVALSFLSSTLQIDISLIARAVRYVTQAHAGPMAKDDITWFREKLSTVLEVARPYSILDEEARPFLEDMRDGIYRSLAGK